VVTIQWIGHGWTTLGLDPAAAATTDVSYEREPGGSWRIVDADIHLNAEDFTWTTSELTLGDRDLQTVLTHEVGHVLGLLHPCEATGKDGAPPCDETHEPLTMYPEYAGLDQRTLEDDDRAGACFLYEPPACATQGCPADMTCTVEGCAVSCDGVVCAVGDRCGPVGCTDEPCPPGSCERGCDDTCDDPGGADGDPCGSDIDCHSGHCPASGACAPLCSDELQCPEGYLCLQSTNPPECAPVEGVLGDVCASGAGCQSGLCLAEDGYPSVCTRRCGEGFLDCPSTYACAVVDGLDVCVPPRDTGGCSIGAPRGAPAAIVLSICLLIFIRRGRP
jgi:hypothetical protein